MHSKPCRQGGAILVMTVLFLAVLLGFSALALDLGRLYVLRTEMQNAADASALAAATELDGGVNAISDAVIAARTLLEHQGRFATRQELLKFIKYDTPSDPLSPTENADNALEFYSWINAEGDSRPDECTPPHLPNGDDDPNKCLAAGDADAYYVRVRLQPDLYPVEEDYYQISLYLLPVLGIVSGEGTALTASTRVTAVAGAGASMICNYPPMFMCRDPSWPAQGEDESDYIGKQMLIKVQKDNWAPGNFGFLAIPDEITDPRNGHTLSGNQALAAALANEGLMDCDPSEVTTDPGNRIGWTRDGLNTRFGIYNAGLFLDNGNPHAAYAAAPNVIDYPRDREFTDGRYGQGWGQSVDVENIPPSGQLDAPVMDEHYIPSTYNPEEYYATYQEEGSTTLPVALGSNPNRYNFYQWELTGQVTDIDDDDWLEDQALNCDGTGDNCPSFKLERHLMYDPDNYNPPGEPNEGPQLPITQNQDLDYLRVARSCKEGDPHYPKQGPETKNCTLLDGAPLDTAPSGPHRIPQKRILYVAEIDCTDIPLHGKTTFDVLEHGRFIKMFLTEHIQPPGGGPEEKVDVYAEYLGPVKETDEKYQDLVHTVIQLYE